MDNIISVIVPVYCVEKYLDRCIDSIVKQTYSNLEIILVDDGSPDKCPEICDSWCTKDDRIKVIHKINGGLSSARNIGIDAASGDYLAFVDSDDWISINLFEKVIDVFNAHDPDIVTFNCNRIDENNVIRSTTEAVKEEMLSQSEAISALLKGNINNYAFNKVYKKSVFGEVRFPEGRLWEDMAIAYKLLSNADKIYCLPEPLYFYFLRSDSISKCINEKALCDIFLARYECYIAVKERFPDARHDAFGLAALSARRLYDRSLWCQTDERVLEIATSFLQNNRETILKEHSDKKYWLFFKMPKLYRLVRKLRHRIGNIVKLKYKKI